MEFTEKNLRLAALIHWADNTDDAVLYEAIPEYRQRILNEIWCLRNGIDPAIVSDLTWYSVPTSTIVGLVQDYEGRTREENSHLLVCTIPVASEIMAHGGDESSASMSEELDDCIGVGK